MVNAHCASFVAFGAHLCKCANATLLAARLVKKRRGKENGEAGRRTPSGWFRAAPRQKPSRFADSKRRLGPLAAPIAVVTAVSLPLKQQLKPNFKSLNSMAHVAPHLHAASLSSAMNIPTSRSTKSKRINVASLEIPRKLFHFSIGALVLWLYRVKCPANIALAACLLASAAAWTLECVRLRNVRINRFIMQHFAIFLRSNEVNRVTGSSYFLLGACVSVAAFSAEFATLSLCYLAFCDPLASLCGKLWGRWTLRFRNGKTLVGCAASFAAAYAVTQIFWRFVAHVSWHTTLPIGMHRWACISAVVVSLAEGCNFSFLFPDDNISIPVLSGGVLTAVNFLLRHFYRQ